MRHSKLMLIALLIIASVLISTAVASAQTDAMFRTPVAHGVHIQPIGNPTWEPVDFHLFSAEIGTLNSGFSEFFNETLPALLPPPNHVVGPCGMCPGAPHAGPYDAEYQMAGFREGVRFHSWEFSEGMGVVLAWMNVPKPGGVTGASPDSANGPIIPHSLFPIHVQGVATRNGKVFDPFLVDFGIPTLDDFGYPGFDGHSHFPLFITTNLEFRDIYGLPQVKANGSYVYPITMLDQTGNGWRIWGHFTVTP